MRRLKEFIVNNPKLILFGLAGFVSAVILSSWVLFFRHQEIMSPLAENKVLSAQDPSPLPQVVEELKDLNLLLLGYGGAGHEGGSLTDVIILAHVDFEQATVTLISIPRDLKAEGNTKAQKINGLWVESYDELKNAIANVTGFSVNYFITVDFVGFQRALGLVLKGIEVDVPETLDDPWYPVEGKQLEPCGKTPQEIAELTAKYVEFELQKQFPCRYEHLHVDKGKTFMDGGDALKYVRSRHSSSDFDRSKRQQAVLVGIKNKLWTLNAWDDLPNFFKNLSQHVQTDLNLDILKYLAPALKKAQDFKIISISLSNENVLKEGRATTGAFILTPKKGWEDVRNFVRQK